MLCPLNGHSDIVRINGPQMDPGFECQPQILRSRSTHPTFVPIVEIDYTKTPTESTLDQNKNRAYRGLCMHWLPL
jgi:hypothetical protein